jgi:hypothetical protein
VVLGGADTVSLLATVVRLQSRHTNLASDVELVSNGGSSGVQPVGFVWGKILERSSLNVLGPLYSMGLRFHLEVTKARVSRDVRTSY